MDPSSNIHAGGKKTFGNLISKVKAKIQEFDQGRWGVCVLFSSFHHSPPCPRSTGQTSTQPTWGANISTYDAQGQMQPAAVTQPSYFDPNSHSSLSTPLVAHQSSPAATPVLKGYDLSPSRSLSKWYTLRYLHGTAIYLFIYFSAYSSSRYAWTTATLPGDEQPGTSFISNWSWWAENFAILYIECIEQKNLQVNSACYPNVLYLYYVTQRRRVILLQCLFTPNRRQRMMMTGWNILRTPSKKLRRSDNHSKRLTFEIQVFMIWDIGWTISLK